MSKVLTLAKVSTFFRFIECSIAYYRLLCGKAAFANLTHPLIPRLRQGTLVAVDGSEVAAPKVISITKAHVVRVRLKISLVISFLGVEGATNFKIASTIHFLASGIII